jgi:hypothetical protein
MLYFKAYGENTLGTNFKSDRTQKEVIRLSTTTNLLFLAIFCGFFVRFYNGKCFCLMATKLERKYAINRMKDDTTTERKKTIEYGGVTNNK